MRRKQIVFAVTAILFVLGCAGAVQAQGGPAPAAEGADAEARRLLETTIAVYRGMSTYRDLQQTRELLIEGDGARILSEDRCELSLERGTSTDPPRARVRPSTSSSYGTVVADGKRIWMQDAAGNRYASVPQERELWLQLSTLKPAEATLLSIPGLFFFLVDSVAALEGVFGDLELSVVHGAEGEDLDVITLALGDGAELRLLVQPSGALLTGCRLIQPLEVSTGGAAKRIFEVTYLSVGVDPPLGPTTWQPRLTKGSSQVAYEELVPVVQDDTGLVGKPLPDFTVPAAKDGAGALGGETLQGSVWVVAFTPCWSQEGRAHIASLGELARSLGADPGVQIAVIAVDEHVEMPVEVLGRTSGIRGYLDPGGAVATSLGVTDPLTLFILDARGVVQAEINGAPGVEQLRSFVERVRALPGAAVGGEDR